MCKDCALYNKIQDEMWQEFNDSLPITETHICPEFPQGIPKEIWNGKECPYFIKKE